MKQLVFFLIIIPIVCEAQVDTLQQAPQAVVYRGGTILEIDGWEWQDPPRGIFKLTDEGRVVFNIDVDERGRVIRYSIESSTLTAEAEKACVSAFNRVKLYKKPGAEVRAVSKGKITFVLKPPAIK